MIPDTKLQRHLKSLRACVEARKWAGKRTALGVWRGCQRADWLLWWVAKTDANENKRIALAACACARTALKYVPVGEDRPRLAIEAAEKWVHNPTSKNLGRMRDAIYSADLISSADNAAYSAVKAAAYAAKAAVSTAVAVSDAIYFANVGGIDEHKKAQRRMCKIIRETLICPWEEPR